MEAALPLLAPRRLARTAGVNHLAFTPDGSLLAYSDTEMRVEVMSGEEPVFNISLATRDDKVRPTERVRGLRFSHDGQTLFIAAGDRLLAIDVNRGVRDWSYRAPRSFGFLVISPIALATSLGLVSVAFDNGTFVVWDMNGRMKGLWHDNDAPRYMGFLPDGDRLVGSDSFGLGVWNVQSRRRELKLRTPDRIYGLATKPDLPLVALRSLHDVYIVDADQGTILSRLPCGGGLPVLAFHPTKKLLAIGDRFGVNLVDLDGGLVHRFNSPDASVLTATFSPDGTKLVAGLSSRRIEVWETPR